MKKQIPLNQDELDMLCCVLCTHINDLKPYPNKRYWTVKRKKQAWNLYQKVGQALAEQDVFLTYTKLEVAP